MSSWWDTGGSPAPTADIPASGASITKLDNRSAGEQSLTELLPSGNPDTDTTNLKFALVTQRKIQLGEGIFQWKGLLQIPADVVITGKGGGAVNQGTTLQGASPDAQIQWGPALGGIPQSQYGRHGGFTIDGAGIAVAAPFTGPLVMFNTIAGNWTDINVINGVGDNVTIAGQNSTFMDFASAICGGCAMVWDNGCGGNEFHNLELANAAQYHLEIRQSIAPPAGAFAVPSFNYVYAGRTEKSTHAGLNLGCVRQLAGAFNFLIDSNFYTPNNVSLIKLQPNTAPGRAGDPNGRLYIRQGTFTGGGAGSAIEANAVDGGGNAQGFNTDAVVILQDETIVSGLTQQILWGTTSNMYQDGIITPYGTAGGFVTTGAGGATAPIMRGLPTETFPNDITVLRDIYIGDYAQFLNRVAATGGYAANQARIIARDTAGDGSKEELTAWFPNGTLRTIARMDSGAAESQYVNVVSWRGGQLAGASGAATYIALPGSLTGSANNPAALGAFYFSPADYPGINGVVKILVKALLLTNGTAPAATFTVGLYPVTAVGGGANVNTPTLGAVLPGSTAAIVNPGASTSTLLVSGDLVAPAAGMYVLAWVVSVATAANAAVIPLAALQVHRA